MSDRFETVTLTAGSDLPQRKASPLRAPLTVAHERGRVIAALSDAGAPLPSRHIQIKANLPSRAATPSTSPVKTAPRGAPHGQEIEVTAEAASSGLPGHDAVRYPEESHLAAPTPRPHLPGVANL